MVLNCSLAGAFTTPLSGFGSAPVLRVALFEPTLYTAQEAGPLAIYDSSNLDDDGYATQLSYDPPLAFGGHWGIQLDPPQNLIDYSAPLDPLPGHTFAFDEADAGFHIVNIANPAIPRRRSIIEPTRSGFTSGAVWREPFLEIGARELLTRRVIGLNVYDLMRIG